jgi:hypothetical protein
MERQYNLNGSRGQSPRPAGQNLASRPEAIGGSELFVGDNP